MSMYDIKFSWCYDWNYTLESPLPQHNWNVLPSSLCFRRLDKNDNVRTPKAYTEFFSSSFPAFLYERRLDSNCTCHMAGFNLSCQIQWKCNIGRNDWLSDPTFWVMKIYWKKGQDLGSIARIQREVVMHTIELILLKGWGQATYGSRSGILYNGVELDRMVGTPTVCA